MGSGSVDLGAVFVVGIVLLLGVGAAGRILAGIARAGRRTRAFLAGAIVARDLPLGVPVLARFQTARGRAHAIWIEIEVASNREIRFELSLSVRLGETVLVEEEFVVVFDGEGDHRGLPDGTALNTTHTSAFGNQNVATTLRAFRFDAPAEVAPVEVRARLIAGPEVSFIRSRLLVTVADMPP